MADEQTGAGRLRELNKLSDADLAAAHSVAMHDVEMIWAIAERRAEKAAGDDHVGKLACLAASAGEFKFAFKALHRRADKWAAEAFGLPVARGGDR